VSDPISADVAGGWAHEQLVAFVVAVSERLAALKAEAAKNSGNSSKPPLRDPVPERQRQAEERQAKKQRAAGGKARRAGNGERRARPGR
jgi:hypothetical protein